MRILFSLVLGMSLLSPLALPSSAVGQVERPAEHAARGVIRRIREGQVTIQHEAIEGVMPAMTMPFAVTAEQLGDLTVGTAVDFVFVLENRRSRIVSIRAR